MTGFVGQRPAVPTMRPIASWMAGIATVLTGSLGTILVMVMAVAYLRLTNFS